VRVFAVICLFIFFFQAEDGIRDRNVTGVQTCALPIWLFCMTDLADYICENLGQVCHTRVYAEIGEVPAEVLQPEFETIEGSVARSEERRVGKECRCRWGPEE